MYLEVGFGRSDITAYEPGLALLGWGDPKNVARGVATPLFARAMVVSEPGTGRKFAYVCADLCFITSLLRREVIARLQERHASLGFDDQNVMLTAIHTHSGPAGFSHHLLFALAGPGISPLVCEALTAGIVNAIVEADRRRRPARLWVHSGEVPLSSPVAFNRSLFAYNSNPEVRDLPEERCDEAVDREMHVLRADDLNGEPLGFISWFGVHGTSVHRDNTLIHGDHKGMAAVDAESRMRSAGHASFVAMFPQAAAGDVTPNFRHDRRRGFAVGRFDDDFRNAEEHASHQSRIARQLFEDAPLAGRELDGPIVAGLRWESLANRTVEAALLDGQRDRVTTPARLGLGMLVATAEGPLPLRKLGGLLRAKTAVTGWLRARAGTHDDWDPKHIIGEQGVSFGMPADNPLLSSLPNEMGAIYRRITALWPAPELAPQILPVQLFGIGSYWIAGLPCEVTTIAARRLRQALQCVLDPDTQVVVNSYANDYACYLTTPQEYVHQHYEAAATLFGRWTLPAWQGAFRSLAGALAENTPIDAGCPPIVPALSELESLHFRPHAPMEPVREHPALSHAA